MTELMKERPAYVRFEKRPIEDRNASTAAGHYVGKDVIFALITPPGSKDVIVREAVDWLKYLDQQVAEGRIPEQYVDAYKRAYDKYLKGEEVPLSGTPIKGWPPLSPAQQLNLIAMNILTVEDLAALNEEGKARFGMGITELVRRAQNWLAEAQSIGTVVARLTAIETEFKDLKDQNDRQRLLIEKLQAENKVLKREPAPA